MWLYGNTACCLQQECQTYRAIPASPMGPGSAAQEPLDSTSAWHRLTHTSDTGAKLSLPKAKPNSWARPVGQDWDSSMAKANPPRVVHTHTTSPCSFPAVPSPGRPCGHGVPRDWGQASASHRAELQRAAPEGCRAVPVGEGRRIPGPWGGREAEGKPLCTLFPQSGTPQTFRQRIMELFGWERTSKGCPVQPLQRAGTF